MTAPPQPSAEARRRGEILRRRRASVTWTAIHLLGSLNLAVFLLITIAGAIAFATVMESKFDTPVAAYYIYNAVWFDFWLLALALNLLCAALTRWPWQRKHLGFVVTHAGIILMLLGGVIGKTIGFEAFVTLDKTKPPETRLFTKEPILTLDTMAGLRGQMPFNTQVRPPTPARPFTLPIEGSNVRLVVDGASDKLVPDVTMAPASDATFPPGIGLRFLNAGLNQDVAANLTLSDAGRTFDFFGIAKVTMVESLPEDAPIAAPPPAPTPNAPAPRDATPFHETQVVFARDPSIVDTDSDALSGETVKLEPVAGRKGEFVVTVTGPNGDVTTLALPPKDNRWSSLSGDGDPIHFRVARYWPDFAIRQGVPVSVSAQPNHPAALVQISGPSRLLPPAPPRPAAAPPLPKDLALRVALAREPRRIVYELEREGKIEARGTAAQGETIHPGWSKWEVRVDAVLPHALVRREVKEFAGPVTPRMSGSMRSGLHAYLLAADGTHGPAEWIPGGTELELFSGKDFLVRVGYGQRVIPLPFQITLEDFQVPRDEGTDTPADFISHVRFDDPASGKVVRDTAHMNSPAMFPGDFWRSLLGWNYKFSQANWDPQNLNETTLQVLYDPGWPFKWIGSIGICAGIALMFYFMPKRSARERSGRDENPSHAA